MTTRRDGAAGEGLANFRHTGQSIGLPSFHEILTHPSHLARGDALVAPARERSANPANILADWTGRPRTRTQGPSYRTKSQPRNELAESPITLLVARASPLGMAHGHFSQKQKG